MWGPTVRPLRDTVPAMSSERPYLRHPSIRGDLVTFVADDDVWVCTTGGGAARRLTAEHAPASTTRLAPDGIRVAYTSVRDGAPEAYGTTTLGGPVRRLTHFGDPYTRVLGWHEDGRVLVASAAGQPFRSRTWAYAVPFEGGPPERLPLGPVTAVARHRRGALVLGADQSPRRGAGWKRYRGGTAAKLWLDPTGDGRFARFLGELDGQLEDPGWVGDRVVFVSDHQGWGNIYSAAPDGSSLLRHSDHDRFYARSASTDGTRVAYQCAGELWLLDTLGPVSMPARIDISLGGPTTGRAPGPLKAAEHLGEFAPDQDGRAERGGGPGSPLLAGPPRRPGPGPERPPGDPGPPAPRERAQPVPHRHPHRRHRRNVRSHPRRCGRVGRAAAGARRAGDGVDVPGRGGDAGHVGERRRR